MRSAEHAAQGAAGCAQEKTDHDLRYAGSDAFLDQKREQEQDCKIEKARQSAPQKPPGLQFFPGEKSPCQTGQRVDAVDACLDLPSGQLQFVKQKGKEKQQDSRYDIGDQQGKCKDKRFAFGNRSHEITFFLNIPNKIRIR